MATKRPATTDDLADWPHIPIEPLARRLGVTTRAIRDRALILGLRVQRAPSGKMLFTLNDARRLSEGASA